MIKNTVNRVRVKDLEQAIDIISRKYPKDISNYKKVAEKISLETDLIATENDVLRYYESPDYQRGIGTS